VTTTKAERPLEEAALCRFRGDAERQSQKQIAIDEHMRQLEEDLGKRANKHVAKHMEAILDVALAEWSRQVQAKLNVQLPPGTLPGASGLLGGLADKAGSGAYGMPPALGAPYHGGITGPQPRLGITGPQPALNSTGPQPTVNGGHQGSGYNGTGYAPTITWMTPPGGGYALPDDEDGDLL
jgi:hypothetical protein